MAARTSLTPAETAETSTKRRSVCRLRIEAIVVLPVPGRAPQQQRHRLVALDQLAQRRALGAQLRLADELVERARPHPYRQRRRRVTRRRQAARAGSAHGSAPTSNSAVAQSTLGLRHRLCGPGRTRCRRARGRPGRRRAGSGVGLPVVDAESRR